ncbi:MAG: Outer membrane TonB-dependent transporter, utilization system for glycans and polysaccharides (PUL), SusC family [uncultured Gemmatimonadetes bacterium]|uniref:Outer membrane TonB-dependent transporter, utilization system for glycans and polysaccharides (PUL), SusC family n=1 Tax=uncultured Gemmatimonadota bacterium TaxID=203437 RepID=A0A6J4L1J1_9BACT|nr:MAG: Outer membrane TonB-dependent transporter, utilization system for glycans and polysaccharides (PUL), SusC family [uncultured Gemmatimonadota bacterium]
MNSPVVPKSRTAAKVLCAVACLGSFALAGPYALGPAPLAAQTTGQINGTVTGEGGRPVSGATVEVVGAGRRTATGPDGRFTLTGIAPGSYTLRITALGHAPSTRAVSVTAAAPAQVSVQLGTAAVGLDSLVVVGYTTQNRRNISGAVTSVPTEAIQARKVATVEQALKGRIAGVNIVSSGEPGRPADVVIRGQNFTTNPSPLYVVDGMYLRQNPGLNPDDIESVQVLKDASAAAQYGAQSANGVILITTKRGRAGESRIGYRSFYGYQEVPRQLDLANAARWAEITRELYAGAGERVPAGAATLNGIDTDWQNEIFRGGSIQDHNLQVSGGSTAGNYLLSGGYLQENGTVIGTGFERFSFRVNSEARRGILTLGQNLSLSRAVRDNLRGSPLLEAVRLPPVIAVRDPNTSSGYGFGSDAVPTFGTNPVGQLELESSTDFLNQVIGTAYAGLRLRDNLGFRFNLGVNYQDLNWRNFREAGSLRLNNPNEPNRFTDRRDNSYTLLFENLLTFDDEFGGHEVNAVAGYTEQMERFNRLEAFRRNYADERLRQINAGSSELNNAGFQEDGGLRSFLVRANYAFDGRYLLTGTFRRDGSSRFGPGNRWGNFGSVSAGWVVSEESFYGGLPLLGNSVDYLKLRASYGILGNQDIGNYLFDGRIESNNRSYLFGNNQIATGRIQLGLANPDIKWQEDRQTNVGADLNMFGNHVTVSADYYRRETGDILVPASIPLSSVGYLNAPYEPQYDLAPTVNAGSIRTSGFELGLQHRYRRGDLRLTTAANLTTLNSEVTSLGSGGQALSYYEEGIARTQVGAPVSSFYVVQMLGIFQSDAEVQAHKNSKGQVIQPGARAGDVRYADRNDDGTINDGDRYLAGSSTPDFEGGLFFDGGYRSFDFSLGMRGVYGNKIFNRVRYWTERLNDLGNYSADLEPWTPQNRSNTTPRAVFGPQGRENARLASDRWIDDGSFLRLQNVEVGYALPNRLTQRVGLGLTRSRVYLNVQNAHTFTGYPNWDPEVRSFDNPLIRGFDDGRIYPNPRTFTIGVDLGL